MSNDVTTPDGEAGMTPPTSRRRALWVATGVAGLTGVVSLAALGGLAARDDKSGDARRVAEKQLATPQQVSDTGKADKGSPQTGSGDDRGGRDRDHRGGERQGKVRDVPCDEEKLVEAVDLVNRDRGGTLRLAPHCTYELGGHDKKSGSGLPAIRHEVTIKGQGATIKRDSEDAFRLFTVVDGGDLTLKDVTLRGGNAAAFAHGSRPGDGKAADQQAVGGQRGSRTSDGAQGPDGGALLVEPGGAAHLVKTTLTGNNAEGNGGAIANYGRVDIHDSKLENNHARKDGGAVFTAGVLHVTGSHLAHNAAGGDGGALANDGEEGHLYPQTLIDEYDEAGTVEIYKSTIESNTADHGGGGVSSTDGVLTLVRSVVRGNDACHSGGGIHAVDTDLHLDHVTIAKNHASHHGGGIVNTGGNHHTPTANRDHDHQPQATTTATHTTITGNTAGRFGGGIFNGDTHQPTVETGFQNKPEGPGDNATLTLRDTDIKGNTALNGGGIFNNNATTRITTTRITKNTATDTSKTHRVAGGILNNNGKVRLDHKTTITDNDPTNCAGTVKDCFN
ncbi:hypothetical protein [Micromonospora sp. KC723]|uniref:hypothetical protein n=1 Tax=Micromonospora sp. KC723 TaxID=2530381 RepID=UPI00104B14DB|nr:hypothetical protein [Micromonospora sp. KC723]TDB70771.1 hypothetical protein E1165_24775 [Micromonospora sp. KC723]